MSTILKALRRLEEEKRAGGDRPLREEVAGGSASDASRRQSRLPLLLGVAGLLVLGIAGGVWLVDLGGSSESLDVAAQPLPVPPAIRPPARASAPPEGEPATAAPVAPPQQADQGERSDAFASRVEVVERARPAPRAPLEIARATDPIPDAQAPGAREAQPAPAATAPGAREAQPAPAATAPGAREAQPAPAAPLVKPVAAAQPAAQQQAQPAVAAHRQAQPATQLAAPAALPEPVRQAAAPPSREPAPKPKPAEPAAPAPLANAQPTPAPAAPSIAPAAPPRSDASPLPNVERTLWHPSAARREAFVTMGGEPALRVHEGDVVGRYVVSEIRASGVIFLHDGEPLERKVGGK